MGIFKNHLSRSTIGTFNLSEYEDISQKQMRVGMKMKHSELFKLMKPIFQRNKI